METLLHIYLFLVGASVSSFLGCLVWRLEQGWDYSDLFSKRSVSETTGEVLRWYELIVVGSGLYYGKYFYSLMEIVGGISAIYLYREFDLVGAFTLLGLHLLAYWDYQSLGIPVILTDIVVLVLAFILFNPYLLGIWLVLKIIPMESLFKIGKGDFIVGVMLVCSLIYLGISPVDWYLIFMICSVSFLTSGLLLGKINMKSKIPLVPIMLISFVMQLALKVEIVIDYITI